MHYGIVSTTKICNSILWWLKSLTWGKKTLNKTLSSKLPFCLIRRETNGIVNPLMLLQWYANKAIRFRKVHPGYTSLLQSMKPKHIFLISIVLHKSFCIPALMACERGSAVKPFSVALMKKYGFCSTSRQLNESIKDWIWLSLYLSLRGMASSGR